MENNESHIELKNDLENNSFFCTEILDCGISINNSVLHLGSGYKESLLFRYFTELKNKQLVSFENFEYTAVDVDENAIEYIDLLNTKNNTLENFSSFKKSAQYFLDEYSYNYDWTLITGIFDKNLYGGETQFEFLDKMISKCMSISKNGVIFTFDSLKDPQKEEPYEPIDIISYLEYVSDIYSVSKITKQNYVFSIKHSLLN